MTSTGCRGAEEPPKYSAPLDPRVRLTDEERLQAFKEWAEEKRYIRPGDGTLGAGGVGGITSLALGGMRTSYAPYSGQLAPPAYSTVTVESSTPKEKEPGRVQRWLEKRRGSKDGRRMSEVQSPMASTE